MFTRLLLSPQAMLAISDRDALDADAGEQDVAKRPEDPAVHASAMCAPFLAASDTGAHGA
jgi:hypothetical protein